MLVKTISGYLDAVMEPARHEIRLAQEQAFERIQKVLLKVEEEVAQEGRFMSTEQRMATAENELAKAEEHLLSALGSMYKAVCYIVPQINPLNHMRAIKDIKTEVISRLEKS